MLGNDDGKQGLLQWIGLPLQRAKAVAKNVRVLRGEGNEAAFRQFGREIMIGSRVSGDDILRTPFQAGMNGMVASLLVMMLSRLLSLTLSMTLAFVWSAGLIGMIFVSTPSPLPLWP